MPARRFATAPSLEEVGAAPATSVPSAEEVAALWEDHQPTKKFARFNKDDPLNMETLLTEEEIMIKDSVRDFCTERLVPRVQDGFRNEEFDRSMVRLSHALPCPATYHATSQSCRPAARAI